MGREPWPDRRSNLPTAKCWLRPIFLFPSEWTLQSFPTSGVLASSCHSGPTAQISLQIQPSSDLPASNPTPSRHDLVSVSSKQFASGWVQPKCQIRVLSGHILLLSRHAASRFEHTMSDYHATLLYSQADAVTMTSMRKDGPSRKYDLCVLTTTTTRSHPYKQNKAHTATPAVEYTSPPVLAATTNIWRKAITFIWAISL